PSTGGRRRRARRRARPRRPRRDRGADRSLPGRAPRPRRRPGRGSSFRARGEPRASRRRGPKNRRGRRRRADLRAAAGNGRKRWRKWRQTAGTTSTSKAGHGLRLVLVDVEDRDELRDGEHVLDLRREVEQPEPAALVRDGGVAPHELADARRVDRRYLVHVDENVL